jgi:hypothetical protein
MRKLLEDRALVEELGRRVDNALGDYHSFTAIERRYIGRFFFFYPYARFAVRVAFYTLPVEHPVRTAIALRVGELTEEEQRELLGVGPEEADSMRALMFGRVFTRDDESGELREQNVRTVNPLGNPITESRGSESILGVLPPVYQWALGQIEKRDVYRDQPWNVGGEFTRPTTDPDLGGPFENAGIRGRILLRQMLELPVPSRELLKHFLPGPQSTESLPFPGLQRPLRHKSPEAAYQDIQKEKRDRATGLAQQILESQLRLFFSKPSDIAGQVDRRRKAVGLSKPAGKLSPEQEKLLKRYGNSAVPKGLDADEISRLLRAYSP